MSSNDAAATPACVTRARSKTPLPAINPKQSHAYGAQGKTNLRAQVRSSTRDFTQDFQTTRRTTQEPPIAEDDEPEVKGPSPEMPFVRGARRGRPASKAAVPGDDVTDINRVRAEPEGPFTERSATALDAEAEYVRAMRERQPEIRPQVHEPSRFRVFIRTLPRYVPRLVQSANPGLKDLSFIFSMIVLLLTIWAWAPVPSSVDSLREDFFHRVKAMFYIHPYDLPPTEMEARWHKYKHDVIFSKALPTHNVPDLQWSININFLERLERVEQEMKALHGDMGLQAETMAHLEEQLPSHVVVQMIDGQYEIPEAFWHALQAKLVEDNDIALRWREWLKRNEHEIASLHDQITRRSLNAAVEERQIVTRETFIEAIKENNDWLARNYKEDYQKLWAENFNSLKAVAVSAATEVVERSPASAYAKDQLANLVKANSIHNTYETLRTINWFSVGLGARVDPHLTSPTQRAVAQSSWYASAYTKFSPTLLKAHPPLMALRRWDESTDCWCASIVEKGYTQITVQTNEKIFPERFVIEHIPATGTLDIAAAPKDFEIWAETHSKQEAERIWEAMYDEVTLHHMHKCSEPPSPKHVCIYQGDYDIHMYNHVQTYRVWPPMEDMAFAVNKFTIKVNTNWGANHTCIYRLRMTGQKAIAS